VLDFLSYLNVVKVAKFWLKKVTNVCKGHKIFLDKIMIRPKIETNV